MSAHFSLPTKLETMWFLYDFTLSKIFFLQPYLINRVDSLHNLVLQELEIAKLDRIISTVILQVLILNGLNENSSSPGNSVTIHV